MSFDVINYLFIYFKPGMRRLLSLHWPHATALNLPVKFLNNYKYVYYHIRT